MPRRLLILGSTGSIGTQALDVVGRSADLEVVGLSAGRSWEPLVEQAVRTGVSRIALADADAAARAAEAGTGGGGGRGAGARAPPRRGPAGRCSAGRRASCAS